MKKIITTVFSVLALVGLYACDNSLDKVFDDDTLVEFQPAVITAASVGRTYPLISSGNSVTAGATIVTQLNLVGRQQASDLTVRVQPDPAATTAATTSYSIANGGNVVIPANSSFGSLTMVVSRATSATAPVGNVVLVIDSVGTGYKASTNYKRVGYSIRQ